MEQNIATDGRVVTRYMTFTLARQTPKTNVWYVTNNNSGGRLGMVRWYGPWRQYVFEAEAGTIFNRGCLETIARFLARAGEA